MKAAGPLAGAEAPVAAGEHVAAEALVEVVVADQLAGVRAGYGPERLAGCFVEHHPIEAFAQCRGTDRLETQRRPHPFDAGDAEPRTRAAHCPVDPETRGLL